jgi:CBS domain-containing protein
MAKAFDFSNPPFDRLSGRELERFKASLDIAFFRDGETIVHPGEVPDSFFIVIKGAVEEVNAGEVVAVHGPDDCFDVSLLVERQCRHAFVVREEAICYLLPLDELLDLTANNKAFAEFFYRDLSHKLDAFVARQSIGELRPVMMARVREGYVHPPLFVDAGTAIAEATRLMKAERTTALLVRDGERIGIVTGFDLLGAVVLEHRSAETPVGTLATFELIGIDADDLLVEALLRMTHHGLERLVVYDRDRITGVLEQVDLLSFLSSQSHILAIQIERATTLDHLRQASAQLPNLIQVLHGHGTKIPFITRLVAELSRRIMAKTLAILAPPELLPNCCLMVMGSEGRGDQILRTDQDNGLILRDGVVAEDLRGLCLAFTDALLSFGYPRCPGDVMVSNPAWAKPLAAFRDDLFAWVRAPDEAALMNIAIFYDAAPVTGDPALLTDLKRYMFELIGDNAAFCAHFAKAIESFDVPLGVFSNIIVERGEHKDQLDLKKGGIFPIVHGVRALALERRLTATNTVERIRQIADMGLMDQAFATDLIEAFGFLLGLRLEARLHKLRLEQPLDNFLRPNDLNKFERDLLKDSFVIINKFKELVRHHFRLKMF